MRDSMIFNYDRSAAIVGHKSYSVNKHRTNLDRENRLIKDRTGFTALHYNIQMKQIRCVVKIRRNGFKTAAYGY